MGEVTHKPELYAAARIIAIVSISILALWHIILAVTSGLI